MNKRVSMASCSINVFSECVRGRYDPPCMDVGACEDGVRDGAPGPTTLGEPFNRAAGGSWWE